MISVRGASEHNLQAIDLDLPRGALIVVTGVSGSGKSSLAFDTIAAEGRRRYLETFSSYARQFLDRISRPAVGRIDGLSPAVALSQSSGVAGPRSTVGTLSDIYDLLRLLWARAGAVSPGARVPAVDRALFSFNSPSGACPRCKGLGVEDTLDPDLLIADASKSVRDGALRITTPNGYLMYSQVTLDVLDQVCRAHGFALDVPWSALTRDQRDVILNGSDRIRIPYGKHPLSSRLRWKGITPKPREEGIYKGIVPVMEQILRTKRNPSILRFVRSMACRACGGTRLRPEALAVTVGGLTIAQAAAMPIDGLRRFFDDRENETDMRNGARPQAPGNYGNEIGRAVGAQVRARCDVLQALGLGYLTLDRESTTLSAGELQRVRLARLACTELGGVLYVLDEPSVGLHHRDTARLLDVLRAIRDRGNTVLVVEHDEQVVRHADWIVDIGPGPGRAGGRLLYNGPAGPFLSAATPGLDTSRTHAFLVGRERIEPPESRRPGHPLAFAAITSHNLHDVAVEFRLAALNVITGVAGAGKTTLLDQTARRLRDATKAAPGVNKVIAIDQAPIGRTPRSNPATYTGLFDAVRDLFAAQPDAAARGFGKGRFSFNVKGGRCEACEGAGVQQIGMHFLGSVPVVCDSCGGRRFNDDTLAVRYRGRTIHDVLDMPIEDAAAFFADQPAIARGLETFRALGLGYLAVGHPATMLSGGEAQRVKLAAELVRPGTGRTAYLLDEPTTGLHAADVALLLSALTRLVERGNTVIIVEHDRDVIRAADWVVDLGPGSGERGGRVVAMGTPETIAACPASVTGDALRERPVTPTEPAEDRPLREPTPRPIRFRNITTHNLRNVDVEIPAGRLTVVTGVSGSGKSSLAFDTVFAESRQRFAETFSTYARRFLNRSSEAGFDEASGLTPAIAISQRTPSRNPRSTVGTMTEILDDCRLLFARAGTRFCPTCQTPLATGGSGSPSCPTCGFTGVPVLTASMFSPNSEHGACPRCKGLGFVLDCDPDALITDPTRPLAGGAMAGHKAGRYYGDPRGQHMAILAAAGRARAIDFSLPWIELDERARAVALRGGGDEAFDVAWEYARGTRTGVHAFRSRWPGLLAYVREEYERKHADKRGEAMETLMTRVPCGECGGGKLKAEFLAVRFAGAGIHQLLAMSVDEAIAFFSKIEEQAAGPSPSTALRAGKLGPYGTSEAACRDRAAFAATAAARAEALDRLRRLRDAGLSYLTLDRPATSLSGGEAQRVRLASELGSGLTGITYVLDEPTVGLHPRDTSRLNGLLAELRDAGNTVLVVEHDRDVIAAADHVIEIGPGAGTAGGRIVASGTPAEISAAGDSRTARLLARRTVLEDARLARARRTERRDVHDLAAARITVRGATVHNLQALDVDLPATGLTSITGVSGSGKSSLVHDVIAASAAHGRPVNCRTFAIDRRFESIVAVAPRGASVSPWSTCATHTGLFDHLRDVFARTEAAVSRGLRRQHFSTQAAGGRCEACEGLGQVRIAMDFLPDLWVTCDECHGKRFGAAVLECRIDGRSIADALDMTADDGLRFFGDMRPSPPRHLLDALAVLADVGLGYVHLGQAARTLSGGERQRLALATGLLDGTKGPALYLFDEPTRGLHADDVQLMLRLFDRLVAAGHALIVIEHNLDVVAASDFVVDLGPEGGPTGGRIIAAGTPGEIAECADSHTGRALALLQG